MISINIPIYRTEKYLRKCIDSVLAQSFEDIEIVLIDDGGADGCGAICDEYCTMDKRIIVVHKKNRGLSSARNNGLDLNTGEYITFVDSDDYIDSDCLQTISDEIVQFGSDVVVYRDMLVDENGYLIKKVSPSPTNKVWIGDRTDFENLVIDKFANSVCDKVYKKSIVKSIRFDDGRMYGEDYKFNLLAINKINSMVYIDKIMYSTVSNKESVTRQGFNPNVFDQIYFKDETAKYIKDNIPRFSQIAMKRAFLARLRVMRPIYLSCLESEYKDKIKSICHEMDKAYPDIENTLSATEKVEYCLFKFSKTMYKLYIKAINVIRKR